MESGLRINQRYVLKILICHLMEFGLNLEETEGLLEIFFKHQVM